jgi:hypothetical protein
MSSVVVFGRKIDSVDVVGAGSTVAILFANDGVPFAFDIDWPEYKRTELRQDTATVPEIFERLSAYGRMNEGVQRVELHKFDCGYFDAGERGYDSASYIQAGCVAQAIGYKDDVGESQLIAPVVNVVPAGVDVVWDDNWRESQLIEQYGDQCLETELSSCIPDVMQAEEGAMEAEITDNLPGAVGPLY